MTLTETALDREMLLVPAPAGVGTTVSALDLARPPHLQDEVQAVPAPTHPILQQVRSALFMVAILAIGLVIQLAWVSNWHPPVGPGLPLQPVPVGAGPRHRPPRGPKHLAPGTPMALITIPSIGVSQVVSEGTSGPVLTDRARPSPVHRVPRRLRGPA